MKDNEDVFEEKAWALLSSQSLTREEAWEAAKALSEHIIPKMMGVLKKLGADVITAEEIVKQAVDKATKMIAKFDRTRARLSTWMTKIAINLLNEKRRRGLLPSMAPLSLDNIYPTLANESSYAQADPIAEDLVDESDFLKKVKSVLHLLSDEERTLINFELNCVPNESYLEIYSISDDAYRQRKSRTLKKLRDLVLSKGNKT